MFKYSSRVTLSRIQLILKANEYLQNFKLDNNLFDLTTLKNIPPELTLIIKEKINCRKASFSLNKEIENKIIPQTDFNYICQGPNSINNQMNNPIPNDRSNTLTNPIMEVISELSNEECQESDDELARKSSLIFTEKAIAKRNERGFHSNEKNCLDIKNNQRIIQQNPKKVLEVKEEASLFDNGNSKVNIIKNKIIKKLVLNKKEYAQKNNNKEEKTLEKKCIKKETGTISEHENMQLNKSDEFRHSSKNSESIKQEIKEDSIKELFQKNQFEVNLNRHH